MRAPLLTFDAATFKEMIRELADRSQGKRESGAFLLTDRHHPTDALPQPVTTVAYYDDLDPDCLTGGITFHANGYTALNALCRSNALRVVGDIHTHPYRSVGQSHTDSAHPMVALDDHIALIAPFFAVDLTSAVDLGVHIRQGGGWASFYGGQAAAIVHVEEVRPLAARVPWWRRLLTRLAVPRLRYPRKK
ncbi:hypothetical protein ABH935_004119 [Catenulispora sp. GAS73]|uniref:hypothetical protein n=1 Tax=Catenulispora sp. GAS73 TaxID=3156269 RepID=UPI0035178B17